MSSLLLLGHFLLLLLKVVGNIDFDAKRISELINARALSANDATNVFSVDLKLERLPRESVTVDMVGKKDGD